MRRKAQARSDNVRMVGTIAGAVRFYSAASLALPPLLFFGLLVFESTGFKNCPV